MVLGTYVYQFSVPYDTFRGDRYVELSYSHYLIFQSLSFVIAFKVLVYMLSHKQTHVL